MTFAAMLILILRMLYFDGGAIHQEAYSFLRVYTDGRPFWETIFNPAFNDWIMYQPRELSYFFDWIDAHIIVWSIQCGWVHFYSLSCLLLAGATIFLQQYGARKCFPGLDGGMITLVSLIYAVLPMTSVTYYRSSKPLAALFLTASCFLILTLFKRLNSRDSSGNALRLGLLVLSLFLLMMSDRQGTFFVAVFAAFCGFALMFAWNVDYIRNRGLLLKTALYSWGIVLFGMLYNIVISPSIIYRLNGYIPDFEYQYTESGDVFQFAGGLEFIFTNLGRFFCGSGGRSGAIAGIAAMLLLLAALGSRIKKRKNGKGVLADMRLLAPVLFLYSGAALVACSNVMAVKCPPILETGASMSGSYATPMIAFLVFFLFLGMNLTFRWKKWKILWILLLAVSLFAQLSLYCPWNGTVPEAIRYTYGNAYGEEARTMKYLLANPQEDFRKYPILYRNMLLLRQMRGLPAFEDETRVYYYLRLYRGKRI